MGVTDSAGFVSEHYYWLNLNLQVVADSLPIITTNLEYSSQNDTVYIHKHIHVVVADIVYMARDTVDSVWINVVSEDLRQGWIREEVLFSGTVPCDPISKFIYYFSDRRLIASLCIIAIALLFYAIQAVRRRRLYIVHFNDIDSPYPTVFCLAMALSAVLYGSIQHFTPAEWEVFYFTPTLNPFASSPLIGCFIASVWFLVVLAVAVIEDMRMHHDIIGKISYLTGLCSISMIIYLLFTAATHYYIGYPLFITYVIFAIKRLGKTG